MWLYRATWILEPPLRWFWRLRVFGAEKVPPRGPLLIASNHASYVDPWFVGCLFPRSPIRFLINGEWFVRSAVWNFVFRSYGVLVTTEGNPQATIETVVRALDAGDLVCVFPEGRISRDGRPGRGRSGIGRMAAASGVPVVPCGIRGAFESIPRHRRLPRRSPVHLHIGDPIVFPGAPTASPDAQEIAAFVDSLMAEIRRLSGVARAEAVEEAPELKLGAC